MAEIIDRSGNIFTTKCEVVTITVNCEGVMGAGIALEGKLRWPKMYEQYADRCQKNEIIPGILDWWESDLSKERVLCFPTKASWKQPSKLDFIKKGLSTFANQYVEKKVSSIAMPHLGCSLGGLTWDEVRPLIVKVLTPLEGLKVELWEFDPHAEDPWYDTLVDLLENYPPEELGMRLGLNKRAINALSSAARMDYVRSLSALQGAPGVGEKTLEKIYKYLFRNGESHIQSSLDFL